MGMLRDYVELPWSHPLRRLAKFRTDEEKMIGGDAAFCARMGITQGQKNRWYHRPELIRYSELVAACRQLGLSEADTHWVLASLVADRSADKTPPSTFEYIKELLNTDVTRILAMGAPAMFLVIVDIVVWGHHIL